MVETGPVREGRLGCGGANYGTRKLYLPEFRQKKGADQKKENFRSAQNVGCCWLLLLYFVCFGPDCYADVLVEKFPQPARVWESRLGGIRCHCRGVVSLRPEGCQREQGALSHLRPRGLVIDPRALAPVLDDLLFYKCSANFTKNKKVTDISSLRPVTQRPEEARKVQILNSFWGEFSSMRLWSGMASFQHQFNSCTRRHQQKKATVRTVAFLASCFAFSRESYFWTQRPFCSCIHQPGWAASRLVSA
ncbi:hypothetical protein [Geomonas limicola]|uniref:hypothetical protein n=1 Tax=Geomonas limicola TaxID=2740186 RepID=UPI00160F8002|nr:hypothetical protein [Geomonas limicola]